MTLQLTRYRHSRWGVDGILHIDGHIVADTTEHPIKYLTPGTYSLTLKNLPFSRRNGPMKNIKGNICVGRLVCSGLVINTRHTYQPIYYRIQKALKRGTPVQLVIT